MKEHPIIFSTPMVEAILAGRKTITRRILKNQLPIGVRWWEVYDGELIYRMIDSKTVLTHCKCPWGKPDDVLWVREKWENNLGQVNFYAGNLEVIHNPSYEKLTKWKPSIHLKRKDARITLKVINIRVERLQDISKVDAINEGIEITYDRADPIKPLCKFYPCGDLRDETFIPDDPVVSFYSLWTMINGNGSWRANPWVWVIEFERLT